MTEPIDERTAAREAALLEVMSTQRRLARPEDYVFDKREGKFWDLLDGTLHEEKSVDASIPTELWRVVVEEAEEGNDAPRRGRPRRRERLVRPTLDIMRVENDQFVEGSTWWPGRPQLIHDWFVDANGFFPALGRRIYNEYKPAPQVVGDATKAGPWIEHVKKLYPDPAEHEYLFDYCAHLIQQPQEKCNAGIVLSGEQRIGKDAILYAINSCIGSWNVKNIEPDDLFEVNKPWVQTLMLVVNEVRPSKDEFHASSLYNILKPFLAAPPHTLPLKNKFEKMRYVMNVMRVFITTNELMAMYIPPGDGRMFIAHSNLPTEWHIQEGKEDYFVTLYGWMDSGGSGHVGRWLAERDLSAFSPKGIVKKTAGWNAIAATWDEPEDCVMRALEAMERPPVVFGAQMVELQFDWKDEMEGLLRSPRKIGHRMHRAGYVLVPPPGERWSFKKDSASFRSRLAFVRNDLMKTQAEAAAAIRAAGEKIVADLARGTRIAQGAQGAQGARDF